MTGTSQAGNQTPVPRTTGADDGFTLVETMISIFLVGVVMAALTAFFVSTLALTNRQSGTQAAGQVATDAIATIRSIKGSALATGRDQASSDTQWASPPPGVAGYLADMEKVWDSTAPNGAGATATLPTSAVSVTLSNLVLQQFFYLGSCWHPAGGGACTQVKPAGSVPFFRAVVAVTWPDRTCAGSLCSFVTSTLVSSASTDPLFNSNDAATAPTTTSPGDQSGYLNSAVYLQMPPSTGGAAPTNWSFTGLPTGIYGTSGGLLTGTLSGPAGTFPVTATVTDAFGLTGSSTFNWTVTTPSYPTEVAADGPWAYYRGEDARSASATPAAADSSGNSRTGVHYGATDGPATWWTFNAGSGTTAADSSGAGNTGSLINSPGWVQGTGSTGLSFDGNSTSVRGTTPAVNSDADFSATAWAYLTDTTGGVNRAVISQNGNNSFGYALRFDTASSRWAFAMANADTTSPAVSQVLSTSTVSAGRWVHLAGTYNAGSGTMTLYVNGVASGTAIRSGSWNAKGVLQAGAEKWNGTASTDVFNGRIDDVRVYQRVLTAVEAIKLATDPPALQWDFSEGSGTSTNDAAGGDTNGTLNGSAAWAGAANGHVGNALSLPGTATSYVSSAPPGIRTDASYTAAAWVYLTSAAADRSIVSKNGSFNSAFALGLSQGVWVFAGFWADTGVGVDYVYSTAAAATNTWVHVAGVFDASADTMTLYVNGVKQGNSIAHTDAHTWDPPGGVEVGRSKFGGVSPPWFGKLDSVRLYQRALTGPEITTVAAEGVVASIAPAAPLTGRAPGALQGPLAGLQSSTATMFAGSTNAYSTLIPASGPADFTTECWFKTNSTTGGQLIGYTVDATGLTNTGRDRMVYLDSGNRLTFGIWWNNSARVIRSPLTYNDGAWHHVATSYGPAGLKLYVDGVLVASNTGYTQSANPAGTFAGYWRWGGGQLNWAVGNSPATGHFTGSIDEVAIYHKQLSDQRIAAHYQSNQ